MRFCRRIVISQKWRHNDNKTIEVKEKDDSYDGD